MPTQGKELTASRQLMGTVDYMAPEQSVDANDVDMPGRYYSLGCTLYKVLTDHVPFDGPSYNTPIKKAMAHAQVAHRRFATLGRRRLRNWSVLWNG